MAAPAEPTMPRAIFSLLRGKTSILDDQTAVNLGNLAGLLMNIGQLQLAVAPFSRPSC